MKTTLCKVVGLPKPGDDLRMNYTTHIGGRTEACLCVNKDHFWRLAKPGEDLKGKQTSIVKPDVDAPSVTYVRLTKEESIAAIAAALSTEISNAWGNSELFSSRAKGDMIILSCKDDKIIFYPMLNGTQAEGEKLIEIEA
jgi:hypothetical protein